jgi:hypothetical protein
MHLSREGGKVASTAASFKSALSPHRFPSSSSPLSQHDDFFSLHYLASCPAAAGPGIRHIKFPGGASIACSKLKLRYPQNTFLRGTPGYVDETQTRTYVLQRARAVLLFHSLLVGDGVQYTSICLCSARCSTSLFRSEHVDPHAVSICSWRRWPYAHPRLQRDRLPRRAAIFI